MSDEFDQQNKDGLGLDDILSEYAPVGVLPPEPKEPPQDPPPPAAAHRDTAPPLRNSPRRKVVQFPGVPPTPDFPTEPPAEDAKKQPEPLPGPKIRPVPPPPEKEARGAKEPAPKAAEKPAAKSEKEPAPKPREKVVDFPEEDLSVTGRLGRLLKHADDYADKMFVNEVPDPDLAKKEQLLPGVDWEDPERVEQRRERRPRRVKLPAPDRTPGELAKRYGRGLKFLQIRGVLALVPALLLLYLSLTTITILPLPDVLATSFPLQIYCSAGLLLLSALLGLDVIAGGLWGILRLQMGGDTLVALAVIATLGDALTMTTLGLRGNTLPYCVVAAFSLYFALLGRFLKRRGLRQTCRVAAAASEPYAVTLDEAKWNGKDAFSKWSGILSGYGSQIQASDGGTRMFHVAAPLLVIASVLFSLLASAGQRQPERILWCLSATLCACASFSSLLCFSAPFSTLTRRLAKCGAALGGWDGIRFARRGTGVVLTDGDLFPTGSVAMNGIKVFGDYDLSLVISYAATLIRGAGSGLDRVFGDMVRTQGTVFRRASSLLCHEGGISGVISGRQIYAGNAAFMLLMDVTLPQGISVKNAIFCAVDGELAGIFALKYTLHTAVCPALNQLLRCKIVPILATRDCNVLPEMLEQKFKLPADKMEFPNLDRRMELSDPRESHSPLFSAVLCREGLAPFAEAIVGGKRLVLATVLSGLLAILGSVIGALLAFYLTFVGAYTSLSALNLLVYMVMWMVPTMLISGWVNRY